MSMAPRPMAFVTRAADKIVTGDAIRQSQKAFEPCLLISSIFGNCFPIIGSTDDGADGYDQDIP